MCPPRQRSWPSSRENFAEIEQEDKQEEEWEERRKKKSREASSATPMNKPIPSAAPSQGQRKRVAPSDEAEESSKRRRVGPLPASQAVGGPAIAAPATLSDSETGEPEIATKANPSASALILPEAAVLSPQSPFRWTDVRNPRGFVPCTVQANNSARLGSSAEDTEGWAFLLTFDARRRRIPTMAPSFFSDGIEGPRCGQTGWCLGDYIERDWMVTDIKIDGVADCSEDGKINHRRILAACNTNEEKTRLICISPKAWPKIPGHFSQKDLRKEPRPAVKKLFWCRIHRPAPLSVRHLVQCSL